MNEVVWEEPTRLIPRAGFAPSHFTQEIVNQVEGRIAGDIERLGAALGRAHLEHVLNV